MTTPWVPTTDPSTTVVWAPAVSGTLETPPAAQVSFDVTPVATLRLSTPPVAGAQWHGDGDVALYAVAPVAATEWPAYTPTHVAPVAETVTQWSATGLAPYLTVPAPTAQVGWDAVVPSTTVAVPPAAVISFDTTGAGALQPTPSTVSTQWRTPAPVVPPTSRVAWAVTVPDVHWSVTATVEADFDALTAEPVLYAVPPVVQSGWIGRTYVGKTEVPPVAASGWTAVGAEPLLRVAVAVIEAAFDAVTVSPSIHLDVVESVAGFTAVSPGAVYLGAGFCNGSWEVVPADTAPVLWFLYPTVSRVGGTVTVYGQGMSGTNGMTVAGVAATGVTYTQVAASADAYTENRRIDPVAATVNVEHDMLSGTVPTVSPPGGKVCATY